jgi:predicted aspartyl protease
LAIFDSKFKPPAPIAEVVISHPVTHRTSNDLIGKLDTGADLTVLPESLIVELDLQSRSSILTRAFDGRLLQRPVYYVRLTMEGHVLEIVRCIASERSNVLLGRNVLNQFRVILDGPAQQIEIEGSYL